MLKGTDARKCGRMIILSCRPLASTCARAAALAVLAQLEFLAEKGTVVTRKPGPLAVDQEFELA